MTKQVSNDDIMQALTQFAESVDRRFEGIDKHFESIDGRFESIDKRLFSMEHEIVEIKQKIVDFDASHDRLLNTIDKFLGRLDDMEAENTARDRQFERLLDWARKVSEKTGVPLENL